MDDFNPLEVVSIDDCSSYPNRSGRPSKDDKNTFGPQTQSQVSKLLQKAAGNVDILKVIRNDIIISGNYKSGSPSKQKIIYGSEMQSHIFMQLQNSSKIIKHNITEDNVYDLEVNATPVYNNNTRYDARVKNNVKLNQENSHFPCDYPNCTYTTKLSSNLYKHKRIHSSEKPYMCDLCSFQTKFVNSLKAHKRTHTDDRPYSCTNCSYCCNSISNLKKHIKHRHFHI